jgi:hypothetical protein
MRNPHILAVLFLLSGTSLANAWSLVPCGADHKEEWGRFQRELRSAKPGSPVYVPHPFPRKEAQVVENFVYQHTEVWRDTEAEHLPPLEKRLFSAIAEGNVRFEILRVENWTPHRCSPRGRRSFFYLVRVYETVSGLEITRASLHDDGLLFMLQHRPLEPELSQFPLTFPDLKKGLQRGESVLGPNLSEPQYVATIGALRCDPLAPCIAFRHAEGIVLLHRRGLYRLEFPRVKLSMRQDLQPPEHRKRLVKELENRGRRLVSLGGDALTTAVAVELPPEPGP